MRKAESMAFTAGSLSGSDSRMPGKGSNLKWLEWRWSEELADGVFFQAAHRHHVSPFGERWQ